MSGTDAIILVSGSLAYDRIMDFPGRFRDHILPEKIHVLSVSFLVKTLRENYGGTAGNIAYNLALLGFKPKVIATAGRDFTRYQAWLESKNTDLTRVRIIENEPTASAYIFTDQDNNQISGFHPGAMSQANPIDGDSLPGANQSVIGIISAGNVADMDYYAMEYQRLDIPYIFDPAQQIPALSAEQLRQGIKGARVFIGNDYEVDLVLKKTGWSKSDVFTHSEMIITTLGKKGSLIETESRRIDIPAVKPSIVKDPTGAGDAYRAGLIKGLVEQRSLEEIGQLASLSAVYPVEQYGTQNHSYTLNEFNIRYHKSFNRKLTQI